jgi:sulfopyruvate decarboxylase subunit beta
MTARRAYLEALLAELGDEEILVSCLGGNARYLPEMRPRCGTFALCDTMGGAIPLALGMALACPERRVTALEGDGALLMNLGTLVTVAASGATNLTVLVFCNQRYESSGGQPLPPVAVDFAGMARAAGLSSEAVGTATELRDALARARAHSPSLLALETAFDPAEPIPPYTERPPEIRVQFAAWLRRHP